MDHALQVFVLVMVMGGIGAAAYGLGYSHAMDYAQVKLAELGEKFRADMDEMHGFYLAKLRLVIESVEKERSNG